MNGWETIKEAKIDTDEVWTDIIIVVAIRLGRSFELRMFY